MTSLDNLEQIKKLDKSGMADFIADLPDQCLRAYKNRALQNLVTRFARNNASPKNKLPKNSKTISSIVVCGMGGSGIGGDIVKALINGQLTLPFIINRSYQLPQAVDKNSLIFLVSYSGNTQETLSCAKKAIQKKAHIFVITSGGKLKALAQEKKLPLFTFSYKGPPRASLGHLFIPILIVLEKLELVNLDSLAVPESIEKLKKFNQLFYPENPCEKNIAKYLAYFLFDHLPIIIAPENLSGIGRRFKTQMAENAKTFSFFETMPEIFHNSVESKFPWRLKDELVFLILRGGMTNLQKSITAYEQLLDKKNIRWEEIPIFGKHKFVQTISLVLLGDWISFYLSMLNEIDPTPVERIEWLKKQLK